MNSLAADNSFKQTARMVCGTIIRYAATAAWLER